MNYTVNSIENIVKYPFRHSSSDNNKINNIKQSLQVLNEPLTQSLTQVQFQIWCTTFTSLNPYTHSAYLTPFLLPLSNLLISCSKSSPSGEKLALVYQFFDLKLHLYLAGLVYTDISAEPLQILENHEKPDVIEDDFYGLQIEILKFFSILLEGLKNQEILGYLYSNKFLPNLTHYPSFINTLKQENNSSYEEAIAYWITLLKNCSLKLKLKPELVELFINRGGNTSLEQMPIYFYPIQYFNNPELMIRISVKVLCLNLFQINSQSLIDLILNSEGEEYDFVNNWTKFNLETVEGYLSSITNNNETDLDPETLWFSLTDNLEFLNDILLTSAPKISNKFLKLNFQQIILPILQNSWTTKEGTKLSLNEFEYFKLINLILKSIKNQNMLNLVVFTLFYNELKSDMEENTKVSECYFIDSKDDKLKDLLNLTELEIEKSENLNPIYVNNPTLLSYITSKIIPESTTPLLVQTINLLNLLVAVYSKDINLKLLLKINVLPSRLTKDLLVVKLGINNNKEFNDYVNSNVKDKPWLTGLLEVNNNNEAKKDDKENASNGNSCHWANLVFYNPELFNTLLNWLQNPLLLTYPKLSKIIKNLIIDLTYFPGIKYCLTKSDGLNLLDLFNSNKSILAKSIPNLILKPLIWMDYFNYFKELEDNSTLTQNLLNSTSFPVESYLTGYSKLVNEHLELFKSINLHTNFYQLLNWNLRIAVQKLGRLSIPLKSTKNPLTNSEIIHLKKSTSEVHFSIGIRIPQNYPTIENLTLVPSKLPRVNFYKLQTTKFLKTQTLKLEYSFNLLELEFLPYLPENSSDKTLLVKNLSNGEGFNLIFLDFKQCEYCRTLMFQKQLEVIEKVEKKLIRMMKLDLSTKLEDDDEDEEDEFNDTEDSEKEDIYEEFMQQ